MAFQLLCLWAFAYLAVVLTAFEMSALAWPCQLAEWPHPYCGQNKSYGRPHHFAVGHHYPKRVQHSLAVSPSRLVYPPPLLSKVQALKGHAYEHLRSVVRDIEVTARLEMSAATTKARKRRRALPSTSEFVYFDRVMVNVQPPSGEGEAQWVQDKFAY